MATKLILAKSVNADSFARPFPGAWGLPDFPQLGDSSGQIRVSSTASPSGVAVQTTANTVNGPVTGGAANFVKLASFITSPVTSSVTISSTITFNISGSESSMSANAGFEVVVSVVSPLGVVTEIIDSERATELSTSFAANNWTATPAAGVTLNVGDALMIQVGANDAGGTMASGFTVNSSYDGASGATGDSWIQLTETLAFAGVSGGTTYYMRSAIDTGISVTGEDSRQMDTTNPGTGSPGSSVTNTTTGPVAAFQVTSSAGGNPTAWYTPQLGAQTISGPILLNGMNLIVDAGAANAQLYFKAYLCNGDGSSPTLIGQGILCDAVPQAFGVSSTSAGNQSAGYINISSTTIANGQRIAFVPVLDDATSWRKAADMVSGHTLSFTIEHTNARVQFTETIAGFVPPANIPNQLVMAPPPPVFRATLR